MDAAAHPMDRPRVKVCIVSCHPELKGGGGAYFRSVFNILRARPEIELSIVSTALDKDNSLHIEPLPYLLGRAPGTSRESLGNVPVLVSGSVRRLEALAYRGPRANWLPAVAAADIVLSVAGAGMLAYPLTGTGRRYVVFAATSLRDEKKYTPTGALRKLLYLLNYPVLRAMEKRIFREAALVFALVPSMCEIIGRENDVAAAKFRIFPVPVDAERVSPGPNPPVPGNIVWMARHDDRRKNTRLLLRATAEVAKLYPEVSLTLLGTKPPPRLMAEARRLGLESRLEVLGWVSEEEKLERLRRADVFVIPSEQEGLCIAGLEAMACAVPVVSTRCGGPEGFVREGVNGFLTPRNDPAALAARIGRLIGDRALRDRLGQAARRMILEEYSRERADAVVMQALREVWPEKFDRGTGRR